MPADSVKTIRKYAVIARGSVGPTAEPTTLRDIDGNSCPVVLYMHDDQAKCIGRMKTLTSRSARIHSFDSPKTVKATPLLAVVAIEYPVPKPRKEMSPEEKQIRAAQLQAGRKKSDKTAVNAKPHTAKPVAA